MLSSPRDSESTDVSMGPGESMGISAQRGLNQPQSNLLLLRAEQVQRSGTFLWQWFVAKQELPGFPLRSVGRAALPLALWRGLGGAEVCASVLEGGKPNLESRVGRGGLFWGGSGHQLGFVAAQAW